MSAPSKTDFFTAAECLLNAAGTLEELAIFGKVADFLILRANTSKRKSASWGPVLPASVVKRYISYDPDTGIIEYLARDGFPKWNASHVGRPAGSPNRDGYIRVTLLGRKYMAHVLAWAIMTGEWPSTLIDHEDTVRDNNKWLNLRPATSSQNAANMRKPKHGTASRKGVTFDGRPWFAEKPYRAQIKVNGRGFNLGYFATEDAAGSAYESAAKTHFGEFARIA